MGFGISRDPTVGVQAQAGNMFGAAQNQAALEEADLLREQGRFAFEEASYEAALKEREYKQYAAKQEHSYLSAGVQLDGSAIAVTAETRRLGRLEVAMIQRRGAVEQRLYNLKADHTERGGLESLLSAQLEGEMAKVADANRVKNERAAAWGGLLTGGISMGLSLLG